jgi:TetR/AcrR family transcriptional repressor of nem operon
MKTHRPKRRRGRPAGSSGPETRRRILAAAAARLRKDGLAATGVEETMRDAGLTHGAFYAHFASRGALLAEALGLAATEAREAWFAGLETLPREARFGQIVGRYLSAHHRDQPATGCAFAALAAEAARADRATRDAFETELRQTLSRLGESVGEDQQALAVMALAVGALALSRAVLDPDLSDALLLAARRAAQHLVRRNS